MAKKRRMLPSITVKAILSLGENTDEGRLVEAVSLLWFEIVENLQKNPSDMYQLTDQQWEAIVAGAYREEDGWERVILTPRSGDGGKDVIAVRHDKIGSIRIVDQVKAYKPGHVVTAAEVRDLVGVIQADNTITKGFITTTSTFAPRIMEDTTVKALHPYRLEMRTGDELLKWLGSLSF